MDLKVKNRQLQAMYGALTILGNKRMANLGADLKVARMLRKVAELVEPLVAQKQRHAADILNLAPLEQSEQMRQRDMLQIGELQRAVDDECVVLTVPDTALLKEADLPKEMSGPEGWKNAAGIGAIVTDLGPLYILDEA